MIKGAEVTDIPGTVPETYQGPSKCYLSLPFLGPECGAVQVWVLIWSTCGAMVFRCDMPTIGAFPVGYRCKKLASSGLKVGTPSLPGIVSAFPSGASE